MRQDISFSAGAEPCPLDHFWNFCVGAGRANEGLRAGWREHLRLAICHGGFRYLRFHGIFHDDMFVCRRENGRLVFNWQYIDDLFDAMTAAGIRPFVELGFFPKDLAVDSEVRCFWWKAHVTPPPDDGDWAVLVEALVRHFVERYGIAEVRQWFFEVWNEPNLWFFFNATRSRYFELYRASVQAVKRVDSRLRVGGPATSNFVPDDRFEREKEDPSRALTHRLPDLAAGAWRGVWIREFLDFCEAEKLPVDFVSMHPYPTDYAFDDGGVATARTRSVDSVRQDLLWLRQTIRDSAYPQAEIHLTEWNSSPSPRDYAHDFPQAAAYILETAVKASRLVNSLSYWTFTDVFEEHGPGSAAFHGGFGMINYQGIVKPSFHAYRFLKQLGADEIFRSDGFLATRAPDGANVRAVAWNYPREHPGAPPQAATLQAAESTLAIGSARTFDLEIRDLPAGTPYVLEVADAQHGFALPLWQKMGSPPSPTPSQIAVLRSQAWATHTHVERAGQDGVLRISLPLGPWAIMSLRETGSVPPSASSPDGIQ